MFASLLLMQASITLPYTHLEYCYRSKDPGCIVERIDKKDVAYINLLVSETIETVSDPSPFDPWTPFPRDKDGRITGDCDDDAATKRQALIAIGFDPRAMYFEVGEAQEADGRWIGHIVLVARINGVEYVLDRKVPDKLFPRGMDRGYAWRPLARQTSSSVVWAQEGD